MEVRYQLGRQLGRQIRRRRRSLRLSQPQLALKLAVHAQTVCDWERGANLPDLPQILRLSHVLRCSACDLLPDAARACTDTCAAACPSRRKKG